MFEAFTNDVRIVMAIANQVAQRWNCDYLGTEHMLMGLLTSKDRAFATILDRLAIALEDLSLSVANMYCPAGTSDPRPHPHQSQRAKAVIIRAIEESRARNHAHVGTEHFILGLIHDPDSAAARTLVSLGISLGAIRSECESLLAGYPTSPHIDDDPFLDPQCEDKGNP